jgi:hypothetical protein
MKHRPIFIAAALLALLAGACRSPQHRNEPHTPSDQNAKLSQGLFLNGTPLFLDSSFPSVRYEKVLALLDGNSLVLGDANKQLEGYRRDGFAYIIDRDGLILKSVESSGGIASACQHPSGAVSVVSLEQPVVDPQNNEIKRYAIVINRLTSNFDSERMILWQDSLPESYYEIPNSFEAAQTNGPYVMLQPPSDDNRVISADRFGRMSLTCIGEELLFAVNHMGQKLYRYDENLKLNWAITVGPYQTWTSILFSSPPPEVSVLSNGDIVTAIGVDSVSIHAYNHRFNSELKSRRTDVLDYDVIVKQYRSSGELRWQMTAGTVASDYIRGMTTKDDQIYLAMGQRLVKTNEPNNTMNWDVAMQQLNSSDDVARTRVLDLDNEDYVAGLKNINGRLYIYGANGYEQADTNSWVTDPHAFIASIDAESLHLVEQKVLRGQRATIGRDLAFDESSGDMLLIGTTDGPITHSTDTHEQGFLARLPLHAFEALSE